MIKIFLLTVILAVVFIDCFKIGSIERNHGHITTLSQQTCNNTNFNFFNMDSFSKNIFMSRALQASTLRGFRQIEGSSFKPYQNDIWAIRNYPKVNFIYHDENQTASFGQNQIILFEGGKVELVLDFQWVTMKKNVGQDITVKEGNATARSISKETPFAITVVRNQSSKNWQARFDLLSSSNISLLDFNISKIDCHLNYQTTNCTVTQDDLFWLKYILYQANDKILITMKSKIQKEFNQKFSYYLSNEICCGDSFTQPNFTYHWKGLTKPLNDPGMNLTFSRANFDLRFQKNGTKPGIYTSYLFESVDGMGQCGPAVPTLPMIFSLFGNAQQFVTLTVFENLLFKGIQSTQIDTILNRTFWATKNFKFYIDDLTVMMPDIIKKFSYSTDVNGLCRPDDKYYKVVKGTNNQTIKVLTNWLCHLNATLNDSNRTTIKLIEFSVNLTSQVYLKFLSGGFDVWLKSYSFNATYNDNFGFKLENQTVADQKIKESLQRLYENKLFGSGWSINSGQRIPALYVSQNYILIYDKYRRN